MVRTTLAWDILNVLKLTLVVHGYLRRYLFHLNVQCSKGEILSSGGVKLVVAHGRSRSVFALMCSVHLNAASHSHRLPPTPPWANILSMCIFL